MSKELIKNILVDILAVICLLIVSLFYENIMLLTMLLAVLSFLMLLILRDKYLVVTYFACSIMGAMAEIIAIYSGAWEYNLSSFLGIPLWLPLLWGIAALFMINLNETIRHLIKWLKK